METGRYKGIKMTPINNVMLKIEKIRSALDELMEMLDIKELDAKMNKPSSLALLGELNPILQNIEDMVEIQKNNHSIG